MPGEFKPDFQRYLSAKVTVDDRALNRRVWEELATRSPMNPKILEVACGTGTMYARMHAWGLISGSATYLGIDMAPENVNKASETGYPGEPNFTCADLFDLQPDSSYDLLISSAFLDLVSLDSALPHLIRILKPGGLAYFPINFDGLTYFEPVHPADAHVLDAYHASMDDRPGGGHSQTGRRLFRALPAAGFEILSVGASDWMVFPSSGSYPGEEAYFLRHILHFFEKSCAGAPGLAGWLADRKAQIGRGELVYIAHQYDFLAQRRF